jgi:hypothetical protein
MIESIKYVVVRKQRKSHIFHNIYIVSDYLHEIPYLVTLFFHSLPHCENWRKRHVRNSAVDLDFMGRLHYI